MQTRGKATSNRLIQTLQSGGTALCMPVRFSRLNQVARMARAAGLDAIYMDMEHSTISTEQVSQLALATESEGIAPLVRVPGHGASEIIRVLEGGATGVSVPHVHTAGQAQAVAAATRFAPLGQRAMAGASAPLGYARLPAEEAGLRLNAESLLVVMIESLEGVANAAAIAAVPGVDLLLIGTGDLSDELGIHGQAEDPRIFAAYESVGAACFQQGKWLGVAGIKGDTPVLGKLHRLGARFLSVRTDETLLLDAMSAENKRMRKLFSSE